MELEYKIVQSTTPHFANTENLRRVLDEEKRAGWQLVEKFDNYKIRLQRDISHRANDAACGFDPYRTHVGISYWISYSIAAALTIGVVYFILRLVDAF
jgi:hypothetical protein